MKFKLTLSILLLIGALNLIAKANSTLEADKAIGKLAIITNQDSDRNEFNLKKKNVNMLIKDKSLETLLVYYAFYLQENDRKRADSLVNNIITSTSDVESRIKISMIAYRYTSDTKTQLLFFSDPDLIQAYRISLMKYNIGTLKSNMDTRTYYYNLVSLDSAMYERTHDPEVRKQLSRHYNSLAWLSIVTQKLDGVEYHLHQSMKYDPGYKYPYSNLPLLFLLEGRYKEARSLYLKYKDLPLDTPNVTYRDGFLEDFSELAKAGIDHPDIKKIKKLLNAKD